MSERPAPPRALYRSLDEAEIGRKHWLTVFTAGMGFFTDAHDLFIIGTVTVLLTPIFHLSTNQTSLLNSISLLASVAGALTFGRLMDKWGRKKMYGVEVSILVVGAILTAFAWNFDSLLVFRLIVGYGVGGDYATSAVITSEYANRKSRQAGRLGVRHAGARPARWAGDRLDLSRCRSARRPGVAPHARSRCRPGRFGHLPAPQDPRDASLLPERQARRDLHCRDRGLGDRPGIARACAL